LRLEDQTEAEAEVAVAGVVVVVAAVEVLHGEVAEARLVIQHNHLEAQAQVVPLAQVLHQAPLLRNLLEQK